MIRALDELLEKNHINYRCYNHPPTYTALETAEVLHVTGYELAKTVILKLDGQYVMAVLPSCELVDLTRFKQQTGVDQIMLATEVEFSDFAPLCDSGCIPAIGNLFGLSVYVSTTLAEDEVISFNAGSHTEDIRMSFRDFEWLVQPRIMDFTTHY
jgi:Ala-tRNA(Pro) deacylase